MPFLRHARTALTLLSSAFAAHAFAVEVSVTNVATFSFQTNATAVVQSISSNAVGLTYPDHVPAPATSSIALMGVSAAGTVTDAEGTQCRSAGGSFAAAPAPTVGGRTVDPASISLRDSTTFHAGDPMFIRLTDQDRNLDSTQRDTLDVRVTTSGGDEEVLRLLETGPDTGVFVGFVQTTPATTPLATFDCRLAVAPNATISVRYVDAIYPTDALQVTALVDPYGTVFDSVSGEPVDGAVVTLLSAATGQPASVFGETASARTRRR